MSMTILFGKLQEHEMNLIKLAYDEECDKKKETLALVTWK